MPENQLEPGHLYRGDAVYIIGDQIEHAGLPHDKLSEYMGQLIDWINRENQINDLLKGVIVHFYLGFLHPYFGDAAYATIRSFVLKFTGLGLLGVQKYGNRNKYFAV